MNSEIKTWKDKGHFFNYDGRRIFYCREGRGAPLLIVHGYPYSSFEWKAVWADLAKDHALVALDLLGMGFSDKPADHAYSFEEHAAIIDRLLDFLGIKNTHILAHDLGVSIVQELIARDLEQKNTFALNSVAFLNGGLFMDVYKPRPIQRLLSQSPTPVGKFISKRITKSMTDRSVRALFGPNTQPDAAFMEKQWEILNYNDGKSIAYLIGRLVFDKSKYQDRWISAMQKTAVPMCFINGQADPNSGIHMVERYKALIPNPKVYLLGAEIGHWPQVEDPQGVVDAYRRFQKESGI
jgi:pimeloyl-ACP methyl ester carboxylesterase